ncbi:MAG: hypothetical protein Q7S79_00700 [bacterium]|nr:hypothetical protein [bacterium]
MQQILKKYWRVIIAILIVGLIFYWYEWRPAQVRKECAARVHEKTTGFDAVLFLAKQGSQKDIDNLYKNCLREKGIEE